MTRVLYSSSRYEITFMYVMLFTRYLKTRIKNLNNLKYEQLKYIAKEVKLELINLIK